MVLNWCDALMVVAMQYRKMQASSEVGFFYEYDWLNNFRKWVEIDAIRFIFNENICNFLILPSFIQTEQHSSDTLSNGAHGVNFTKLSKGRIISKGLFDVLEFSQKTNEQICRSRSKNEFICSFFWRILGLTICFRN